MNSADPNAGSEKPRMRRGGMYRWARRAGLVFILLAGAVLVLTWPPGRSLEAVNLLAGFAEVPAHAGQVPAGVTRRLLQYQVDGRVQIGDLYTAPAPRRAGLVLVPGLTPYGKDDSHVVALAGLLASHGFAVLVPDLPGIRRLIVRPRHARDVADAARHLAARIEAPKVGIVAVSYAVGPAIQAALMPGARDRIGFVAGVGGYYSLENVVRFFSTGHFRDQPNGPWLRLEPNRIGRWLFARGTAAAALPLVDQSLISEIADRRIENPAAPVADLVARLGPEGQSVFRLLVNRDPARVPALVAALPKRLRDTMTALDLAGKPLSDLKAELVLIHGEGDAIIPWTESRRLAAAAPAARTTLYLVGNLDHVEIGPGSALDGITTWRAVRHLLQLRDRFAVDAMAGR